jgi:hypothetical protein
MLHQNRQVARNIFSKNKQPMIMENFDFALPISKMAMDKIWVQKVIIATVQRRGQGKVPHDPIRIITQVFSLDGKLIAEFDPLLNKPQ